MPRNSENRGTPTTTRELAQPKSPLSRLSFSSMKKSPPTAEGDLLQTESLTNSRRNGNGVRTFYSRIAAKGWKKSNYFTDASEYRVLRKWISDQLPVRAGLVISIGCGTGELERDLADDAKHRVVGLDFSHDMLRAAGRLGSRVLVQADAHTLPFAGSTFDAAVLSESIGHLELERELGEIARVLRKRGWLLITTYPPHRAVHSSFVKYRGKQVVERLAKAGFNIKGEHLLKPGRKMVKEVQTERDCALIAFIARKSS